MKTYKHNERYTQFKLWYAIVALSAGIVAGTLAFILFLNYFGWPVIWSDSQYSQEQRQ